MSVKRYFRLLFCIVALFILNPTIVIAAYDPSNPWLTPYFIPNDDRLACSEGMVQEGVAIEDMTLEERIAQMLMVRVDSQEQLTAALNLGVGGVLPANNLAPLISSTLERAANTSPVPTFVAADAEGGRIDISPVSTDVPSPREVAETLSPAEAADLYQAYAEELRDIGITMNLAPVVDLVPDDSAEPTNTNGIGDRSFSNSPQTAIQYAQIFNDQMSAASVFPTIKHFPGHGRAQRQNGNAAPNVTSDTRTLYTPDISELEEELSVYRELAGSDTAIMLSNLYVRGYDDENIAPFSERVIEDLLRQDVGFNGLVITDALNATPVQENSSSIQDAVVQTIAAGADIALVFAPDIEAAINDSVAAVATAVENLEISEDSINESVERIFMAKEAVGLNGDTSIVGGTRRFSDSYQTYPNHPRLIIEPGLVAALEGTEARVEELIPAYRTIAARWGVPWQLIAAKHYREANNSSVGSMVNGRERPVGEQIRVDGQYSWASANANIDGFYGTPTEVSTLPRRHYAGLLQDLDYGMYLTIEHGTRYQHLRGADRERLDGQQVMDRLNNGSFSVENYIDLFDAYYGGFNQNARNYLDYGSFGFADEIAAFGASANRPGAGAIFTYYGGWEENPPAAEFAWPGVGGLYTANSSYNEIAISPTAGIGFERGGDPCDGNLGDRPRIDDLICPEDLVTLEVGSTTYYQFPEAPAGEYIISGNAPPSQRFGHLELVCMLYTVGLAYFEYAEGNSRLIIGDLNATGHRSHNVGIAVDVLSLEGDGPDPFVAAWSYYDLDSEGGGLSARPNYSAEATIDLGYMFVDTGLIRDIWWCGEGYTALDNGRRDSAPTSDGTLEAIREYGEEIGHPVNIQCLSNHRDHFHININVAPGDFHEPN